MTNCNYFLGTLLSRHIFLTCVGISLFISVYIYVVLKRKELTNKYVTLSFLCFWIGSFGNLYYRILGLCVPDPLSFFGILHFNWFDVLITTGIFVIIGNILHKI